MWINWQNLNDRPARTHGSGLVHGRAWLHVGAFTFGVEWTLRSPLVGVSVRLSRHDDHAVTVGFGLPFAGVWFSVEPPYGRLRRMLPATGRTIGLTWSDGTLRLSLWDSTWGDGARRWWHEFKVRPADLLLGRTRYSERELAPREPVVVPMPEGTYAGECRTFEVVHKRPRWFARRRVQFRIEVPRGVPVPGKGENSWDCGEDAIYGQSTCDARSVEEAVGSLVTSALVTRRRYGGRGWTPAPRKNGERAA